MGLHDIEPLNSRVSIIACERASLYTVNIH